MVWGVKPVKEVSINLGMRMRGDEEWHVCISALEMAVLAVDRGRMRAEV